MKAGGGGRQRRGADSDLFARELTSVCRWLAIQMVKDGEGAEHAVRVVVTGARDGDEAEAVVVAAQVGVAEDEAEVVLKTPPESFISFIKIKQQRTSCDREKCRIQPTPNLSQNIWFPRGPYEVSLGQY